MALYDDFPYTNFHSLNLDWIVKKLSELENGESTEESSSSTETLARNLSGNYPYTNFHSLNLDWIIRSMFELESGFETVENEWQSLRSTGLLNDEVKNAILQCFQNVAWINDQGQTYYDALHDVFFPPVVVSTLTAVLDQGERVFHTGEDVNVIKDYLTVTAKLSDGTLITVPSAQYILTGSLSQEGPNIIIVSYMNASTTITVNAVAVSLVSISAVYTQSGTVYTTDTLDSLKSDLVVTATYSDSSTETVPSADYTLNGTLAEGTSTITVSYDGKTTTFNVTVVLGWDYKWTYTDGALTDNGWNKTTQMNGTASLESDGLLLSGTQNDSVISFSNDNWKSDNVEACYEVMFLSSSTNGQKVLGISKNGSQGARFSINTNTPNMMEGSTLKAITGLQFEFNRWYTIVLNLSNGSVSLSVDGDQVYTSTSLATNYIANTAIANVGSGSFKLKSIKFRSISQ